MHQQLHDGAKEEVTALSDKKLLLTTAAFETATGLLLLITPGLVVGLLLGASPDTPVGVTTCRIAGAALVALGIACWRAGVGGAGRSQSGLLAPMLFYNAAVNAILLWGWMASGLSGLAFWPAVIPSKYVRAISRAIAFCSAIVVSFPVLVG